MKGKDFILDILFLIAGIALIILNCAIYDKTYIASIGSGLIGFGLSRLIHRVRYISSSDYAKRADTANNDERIKFISERAKSWTFGITILLLAMAGILLQAANLERPGLLCFYIVCGMCFIYALIYFVLSRKY